LSSSRKTIFVAIAANVGIAVAKFVGFAFTGSSAMLSEAIHSLVDCGNGGLLLFGQRQAAKPADELHPFGYGKELYFWSLIVAVLIFVLGGGISVAEGIDHVRHPAPETSATWAYAILLASVVFEGYSFVVSIREFKEAHPGAPILRSIHTSKDPSSFTVIFEDTAALLGLIFALLGIWLSHSMGMPRADGAASILIGLLLLTVSVLLIAECKNLLVGEGADRETLRSIRELATADPDVLATGYPFTMYFGPHTALLVMNIKFREGLSGAEHKAAIERIETAIRSRHPEIQHISLEFDPAPARLFNPSAH
jgi:cation diffusion facilitator family transporter